MKCKIKEDILDGSNWICVNFEAHENQLEHDPITELEMIRHKHNLSGGSSNKTQYINGCIDSMTVYIENPTEDFRKDLTVWLFTN